jgi:prevent-host-death family protein
MGLRKSVRVSLDELKQNLSEYLELAGKGELVVVTDRGVPKVLIPAIPGVDHIVSGVEQGWVTLPTKIGKLNRPLQLPAAKRSLDVLNEDRTR